MSAADNKAVFLSYASQDAEAARRICEALRQAGVEVWFDQSELVGGDAWDAKIRGQIGACALFVPVISANTQARGEGYFRLEWKLAVDRSHLMAHDQPFLLPVGIDATKDGEARVPPEFRAVQWTKLPAGETSAAFCERVKRLLGKEVGPVSDRSFGSSAPNEAGQRPALPGKSRAWLIPVIFGMVAIAVVTVWLTRKPAAEQGSRISDTNSVTAAPLSEARQLVARVYAAKLDSSEATRAAFDAADQLCEKAAALDPADAEVWAAWAYLDAWLVQQFARTSGERRESARRKAAQAMNYAPLAFNPRLAQAAYFVHVVPDQSASRAESILQQLLAEQPEHPGALRSLVHLLRRSGRTDEAYAMLDRLQRVPGYAATAHSVRGWTFRIVGRLAAANAEAEKSLAAGGGWAPLALKTDMCLHWDGDLEAAKAFVDQMPPELLLEDDGAFMALKVFEWRREPNQALRVLQGVNRDWLFANGYNGPKALLVGQAYLAASRPDAARSEFQLGLRLVNERLVATPGSQTLLTRKFTLQEYLGDMPGALETRRLLAQVSGNAALANPPTVASRLAILTDPSVDPARRTAASLRLDPAHDDLRAEPGFKALLARAENDPLLSPQAAKAAAASAPDAKSVAVLAFANLSDDKANEYFSDGISEELLNVLAKIPGLKVSARTSAFYFKGKDTPIPEIARQLGVAYVIEGSVRKQGDRVRITAQLIKAADGFHVWRDTFTRDLKDIFAVQDEIAALVAKNLELKLGLAIASPTIVENAEANRLYFEALAAWNLRTRAAVAEASQLLLRALELQPRFARAKALLSQTISIGIQLGMPGMTAERALQLADEALAIDPLLAQAHAARSGALDTDEAVAELRRAIELDPNYATGHQWLGRELSAGGRMGEALVSLRRAAELDPLSHRILDNYAQVLAWSGDLPAAMATVDRALRLQPSSVQARVFRAGFLLDSGRPEDALVLLADPEVAKALPHIHARTLVALNRRAEAQALVAAAPDDFQRGLILCALGSWSEARPLMRPQGSFDRELILWELPKLVAREDASLREALADWGLRDAWARAEGWWDSHPQNRGGGQ